MIYGQLGLLSTTVKGQNAHDATDDDGQATDFIMLIESQKENRFAIKNIMSYDRLVKRLSMRCSSLLWVV